MKGANRKQFVSFTKVFHHEDELCQLYGCKEHGHPIPPPLMSSRAVYPAGRLRFRWHYYVTQHRR